MCSGHTILQRDMWITSKRPALASSMPGWIAGRGFAKMEEGKVIYGVGGWTVAWASQYLV